MGKVYNYFQSNWDYEEKEEEAEEEKKSMMKDRQWWTFWCNKWLLNVSLCDSLKFEIKKDNIYNN